MVFILGTHFESTQWVNIEPCGLFCGCMTYFLLAYGMYATSTCVIIPWLGFSVFGIFNLVLFNLVSLMGMYCHFKTMTTDPGAVPKHAKPLLDDAEEKDFEANEKTERFKKFCRRCRAFKPHRAHHCSLCGRCIVKMDHHCPWVNNCVGVGNHKLFLQFLFWVFASCIYSLVLVAAKYIRCLLMGHECNNAFDEHLLVIFLSVEAILFALFTLCMLGDQISSISQGSTQIDRLKKTKFKQQTEINEVFGSPVAVYCAWDWLYPLPLRYPSADVRATVLGYTEDGDGTTGSHGGLNAAGEADPLMMCEPVSPMHGGGGSGSSHMYLSRSKTDSNRNLGRNVTALLKKNGQINGDESDESNYGEESIQEWGHQEPLIHSNALMNAALHEVELVSDPGSVDTNVANSKEEETARLLGSTSGGGVAAVVAGGGTTGNGSNGSIAGINGNVRKRV